MSFSLVVFSIALEGTTSAYAVRGACIHEFRIVIATVTTCRWNVRSRAVLFREALFCQGGLEVGETRRLAQGGLQENVRVVSAVAKLVLIRSELHPVSVADVQGLPIVDPLVGHPPKKCK